MNPLDSLGYMNHAGNAQNALVSGIKFGTAMREQKMQAEREKATDEAFRGMMGGDPNAINALAQIPGMAQSAYQMQGQQQAAQAAAQERQTRIDIAEGRASPTALAGINWDDYAALTKEQAETAKQNVETVGQLALMADTPQKWDAVIDQLGPQFAQYKGQFGQREAIIARAGQVKEFLQQQEPKYMAVPMDSELVNVKDPEALKAFASGRDAPQVAEGQTATNPQTGEKIVFQGGQWVKQCKIPCSQHTDCNAL